MKGAIVTMEQYDNRRKGSVGSSRIRGEWMIKYWDSLELYKMAVADYQFMIFQKAYWKEMVTRYSGIKIFDICDPDWLDNRPVVEMIEYCDACVTSSDRLAEQIRLFDIGDKPVVCIPDRIDFDWSAPVKEKHEGEIKSVVWFGYSTSSSILDKAVNSLKKRGIKLTVISDRAYINADNFIQYNHETVNAEIVKHDAVLLPPYTSETYKHQFKSNNKTVQSWALKMPVVTNADELDLWNDPIKRQKEVDEKYKQAQDFYNVKQSVDEYKLLVDTIKEGGEKLSWLKKVQNLSKLRQKLSQQKQ